MKRLRTSNVAEATLSAVGVSPGPGSLLRPSGFASGWYPRPSAEQELAKLLAKRVLRLSQMGADSLRSGPFRRRRLRHT
eukprot:8810411-Alexandrium_andersonii.AAC.1